MEDHSRDAAGLTYVYPVISRRSGGVSVGINLNPNNACNWACAYCQVEGLVRGAAPAIDLEQLSTELAGFLDLASTDAWMEVHAPRRGPARSRTSPSQETESPPPATSSQRSSSA